MAIKSKTETPNVETTNKVAQIETLLRSLTQDEATELYIKINEDLTLYYSVNGVAYTLVP